MHYINCCFTYLLTYLLTYSVAQQVNMSTHPSFSTNAVATHLIQVAKAPHDKKFERQLRMQGRTLLQQMSDKSLPHQFTEEEISAALQKTKPANLVLWQNWMAAYLGYTLRIKTLFRRWPVMSHDTHTRIRRQWLISAGHSTYWQLTVTESFEFWWLCDWIDWLN